MTSSMVGESLHGPMEKCTKVNFGMILGMVQELTSIPVEKWENLCGLRAKSTTDFIPSKKRSTDAAT